MSLLIVWGELLCMVTSARSRTTQQQTCENETESQNHPAPVSQLTVQQVGDGWHHVWGWGGDRAGGPGRQQRRAQRRVLRIVPRAVDVKGGQHLVPLTGPRETESNGHLMQGLRSGSPLYLCDTSQLSKANHWQRMDMSEEKREHWCNSLYDLSSFS